MVVESAISNEFIDPEYRETSQSTESPPNTGKLLEDQVNYSDPESPEDD